MATGVELASADSETYVLGIMLTERMAVSQALTLGLTRDDYAWEVNALIHDAINRITERGDVADRMIVCEELAASNLLEAVGGEAVIEKIIDSPFDPHLLDQYVGIIRDRSMRRRCMAAFEQGARILVSEPDGKKAVESVQQTMYRAWDTYMANAFQGITPELLRRGWGLSDGYESFTPYPHEIMNDKNRGRAPGSLTIFGGYPSDGKSIFGLRSIVRACSDGKKCAWLSLEMTQEQLTVRLLSYLTGISTSRLLDSNDTPLEPHEQDDVNAAFDTIESWDLTIYCDPSMSVNDIRNIQLRERYDHIVIDYLQRFDFLEFSQVPRFARLLKNLALSTLCTIDLLSQINPSETRPGDNPFTKPNNLKLYGGKATGHEADNIYFYWDPREQDEHGGWKRTGEGFLICTKARDGESEWEEPIVFIQSHVTWEERRYYEQVA